MNLRNDIGVFKGSRSASRQRALPALMALEARMVPANFTVDFVLTNDWVSGYQAAVKVTNLDSTPVTDWKLEFDYASNISSLWDAQLASHVGNHYLVAAPGWTTIFPPRAPSPSDLSPLRARIACHPPITS